MINRIFRKSALERLSTPEQLDQLTQVASPRGWVALGALSALVIAAAIWSVIGSLQTQVYGSGIMIHAGGIRQTLSTAAGQVRHLHVAAGDNLVAGQVVAEVYNPASDSLEQITELSGGLILEVLVSDGSMVEQGAVLLNTIDDNEPLEVIGYLPAADGKKVQVGMEAAVYPESVPPEEYGYIHGSVQSVGDFPASVGSMWRVLQNEHLVSQLAEGGAPIEVRIALQRSPREAGGFHWSASQGPPRDVTNGTLSEIAITIQRQRPINLVVPAANLP